MRTTVYRRPIVSIKSQELFLQSDVRSNDLQNLQNQIKKIYISLQVYTRILQIRGRDQPYM